jgi:hypothetical protein
MFDTFRYDAAAARRDKYRLTSGSTRDRGVVKQRLPKRDSCLRFQ